MCSVGSAVSQAKHAALAEKAKVEGRMAEGAERVQELEARAQAARIAAVGAIESELSPPPRPLDQAPRSRVAFMTAS